eukprot:UN31395
MHQPNHDISKDVDVTEDHCRAMCDNLQECMSYDYQHTDDGHTACWLQSERLAEAYITMHSNIRYCEKEHPNKSEVGYECTVERQHPGDDINFPDGEMTGTTLESCGDVCTALENCRSYEWKKWNGGCYPNFSTQHERALKFNSQVTYCEKLNVAKGETMPELGEYDCQEHMHQPAFDINMPASFENVSDDSCR